MSSARTVVRVFPVRHLSPICGHHVQRFLEELRPTAVLIEGLSDASSEIPHFMHPATRFPIALLAYTTKAPIRTLLYPICEYSAEYSPESLPELLEEALAG